MKKNIFHASALGLAMSVIVGSASAAGFSPLGLEAIKDSANLVVSHFLAQPDPEKGLAEANTTVAACYGNFLPDAPSRYHQSFMNAGLKCMAADMSDWTLHEWVRARVKTVGADNMYGITTNEAITLISHRMADANEKYGTIPADIPFRNFVSDLMGDARTATFEALQRQVGGK
ncbi:hypothetical protein GXB81_03780 [Paraburkholderia sp. Ac-20336]|uniref:hypothetical protein n=1 Tax=Paraburkholderia sp. Ac-20336 TaxID=2703886 RepID=UPI0019808260|nr:hypothetical protein [Paraburkholderia sp. Ac-20336]MBN3802176.1 hypothetical protein [Paraburkholderia sp. Ac-20336]